MRTRDGRTGPGQLNGCALAAAVSNGGGLGLVGGGSGERTWLERELANVIGSTERPWGVGFLSWALEVETLRWTLEHGPKAIMLSFGDPRPFARSVRDSTAKLIIQVTDLDEASPEALVPASVTEAILEGSGGDTERSRVLDIARRSSWPHCYTARTLRDDFLDLWRDKEDELREDGAALDAYALAAADSNPAVVPIWAGEGIDVITESSSATGLVSDLMSQAEEAIACVAGFSENGP
jgi:NAD(P)H-dependent flavin oxidoreductase YrpB (nitropropane dioxygenase family)